ncbi:MAG: class 1 fructose-bisphosphatase [Pseudomonadota bacterium]
MASTAPNVENLFKQPSLTTLQTHMLDQERRFPESQGALSWIVSALGISAKTIAARLKRARIEDVLGDIGTENVQGENQQKLDVIANEVLIQVLRGRDGVGIIGSEEDDELIVVNSCAADSPRYAVLFDPLDGSSNLDVGGSVGTIFSIFKMDDENENALKKGRDQVAAGYVLYGSSTIFVLTTGSGVHMFVLDPAVGAFMLVEENLRIPDFGKLYSVNEANADSFSAGFQDYLAQCKAQGFSSRYSGAMVADVHRVLMKGGIFLYPATEKAPNGKLRLMYEANPMAMIIKEAGGGSSTGEESILDIEPKELHQRTPVILGSNDNVADLMGCLNGTPTLVS